MRIVDQRLLNSRLFAILWLGFASGLPLALTGATLQAWFTESHISLMKIGALSLLGIPYALKFLWAPLMDYYSLPVWGKRKGWILLTQGGLVIALFGLAQMQPGLAAKQMALLALVITFLSASQDISINAYQTDILPAAERGLGAAYTVFAYRIAMLLSGGLALMSADYIGWKLTYELMALFMLIAMIFSYYAPRSSEVNAVGNMAQVIGASLQNLWQRERVLWVLLFIMLYKFGDALALSLVTNFLLHGLGFSLTQVGLANKVVGVIATLLGTFVGGFMLTRWHVYRGLMGFGLAQAFSNLMFVLLALVGKHFTFMAASLFIESFCSGLSTAALLAFMMSLCDHRYSASQFALLSAIASLGRVFLGPLAALMVEQVGWASFYLWSVVLCFPGLFILWILKNKVLASAPAIADAN